MTYSTSKPKTQAKKPSPLGRRLYYLGLWRRLFEVYADFVRSAPTQSERVAAWDRGDAKFRPAIRTDAYEDAITAEVVELAMMIAIEIGLAQRQSPNVGLLDPDGAFEGLRKTFGGAVCRSQFDKMVESCTKKLSSNETALLDRLHATGATGGKRPEIVESAEIALVLRLTDARKRFIFGDPRKIMIRAIDAPECGQGYPGSNFDNPTHAKARRLASEFKLKPETIIDWLHKGVFEERVDHYRALLLPPEILEIERRGNEHPMKTAKRVRKKNKRQARRRKDRELRGYTMPRGQAIRDAQETLNVSRATVYRMLKSGELKFNRRGVIMVTEKGLKATKKGVTLSEIHETNGVTLETNLVPISRGCDLIEITPTDVREMKSQKVSVTLPIAGSRLTKDRVEAIIAFHFRKTGELVKPATVRQWKVRGKLDAILAEMAGAGTPARAEPVTAVETSPERIGPGPTMDWIFEVVEERQIEREEAGVPSNVLPFPKTRPAREADGQEDAPFTPSLRWPGEWYGVAERHEGQAEPVRVICRLAA